LEYWLMKTDLLKKRQNPTLFGAKEIQQKARKYLMENSKLQEQPFWSGLDTPLQENAMKCFSMLEVQEEKKEMVAKTKSKSALYVCLSGNAFIRNMRTDVTKRYGPGDVFGGIESFNEVVNNFTSIHNETPYTEDDFLIEFEAGTFMRLDLKDLYNTVLRPDPGEEERLQEAMNIAASVKISGISWENQTDDDKFYIQVYQRAQHRVNKVLFGLMDSYRMIPKNASMSAYKYYNEGRPKREIFLDPCERTWVFVVIDGTVRVDLCPTGTTTAHTFTCQHKDNEPIHVKLKTMPLIRMGSGSVLCLFPECFSIGAQDEDSLADFPFSTMGHSHPQHSQHAQSPHIHADNQMKHSASGGRLSAKPRTASARPSSRPVQSAGFGSPSKPSSSSGFSSNFPHNRPARSSVQSATVRALLAAASVEGWVVPVGSDSTGGSAGSGGGQLMNKMAEQFIPCTHPPKVPGSLYNIRLTFETETTYLAVPCSNFTKILGDSKLCLPKIADEVAWHLRSANDLVKGRIDKLLPWIQGDIAFDPTERAHKKKEELGFLPAVLGPTDTTFQPTIGSFNISGDEFQNTVTAAEEPDSPSVQGRNAKDDVMSSLLNELRNSSKLSPVRDSQSNMFLTQPLTFGDSDAGSFNELGTFGEDSGSDSDFSAGAFDRIASPPPSLKPPAPRGLARPQLPSPKRSYPP